MQPSSACFDLLDVVEGFRAFPYPDIASKLARATPQLRKRWGFTPVAALMSTLDPVTAALSGAPWTWGYGETHGVDLNGQISRETARAFLIASAQEACREMLSVVAVPLTQGMVDALTSFVYNEGLGAKGHKDGFAVLANGNQSHILSKLNARDYAGARDELLVWIWAGGERNDGLAKRRHLEFVLFGEAPPDFSNVTSGVDSTAKVIA